MTIPRPTLIKSCLCPVCHTEILSVDEFEGCDEPPDPGDFLVCVGCTAYLVFDPDMSLRLLTPDEFLELPPEMANALTRDKLRIQGFNMFMNGEVCGHG